MDDRFLLTGSSLVPFFSLLCSKRFTGPYFSLSPFGIYQGSASGMFFNNRKRKVREEGELAYGMDVIVGRRVF
jgi:hypothetical protein